MSTTMTISMSQMPHGASSCPNCGIGLPAFSQDVQQQIEDLQAQIRLLSQKATSAVDKWADYEDEIQQLKAQLPEGARASTPLFEGVPFGERPSSPAPNRPSYITVPNRLSSFLSSRKSNPNLQAPPTPNTPSSSDLAAALSREQSLRQAAEGKLSEASGELEELSAQLFQQANEMVATERKARARLEERVEVLEQRDVEKRKRLERLEGAMQRIERMRGLLAPGR